MTCFCRQTSFTVRNFLKRSEIFWSDIYGVNSLASDSRPTRKTDTVVQDGHVCLLRFGCNAVCETLLYQFTSSTFGVWIFNFFFPSSLLFSSRSPCLFSFSLTVSTCVCTVCVKELVSSISRVPPSSTHTHTQRETLYSTRKFYNIPPHISTRRELSVVKKSLSLALFYCADSGGRRTLRQERNRLSLRFLCLFILFIWRSLSDDKTPHKRDK